jgi:anti-sigma28 factor (negative regulator of flagellin synthesis)
MKDDNSEMELRIAQKEQRVSELEIENRSLQEKKTELLKDLETTKLNLDQLSERLKSIQMENDRIQAITPEQLQKQKEDSARLKDYRDEIELLLNDEQLAFDERGSKIDKQKRIEELREEINLYLQFGLE